MIDGVLVKGRHPKPQYAWRFERVESSPMGKKPLTPTRENFLKLVCKCILRSEKRIIAAGHIAKNADRCGPRKMVESKRVQTMAKHIRAGRWEPYALALSRLRVARSRAAAELEGAPF